MITPVYSVSFYAATLMCHRLLPQYSCSYRQYSLSLYTLGLLIGNCVSCSWCICYIRYAVVIIFLIRITRNATRNKHLFSNTVSVGLETKQ